MSMEMRDLKLKQDYRLPILLLIKLVIPRLLNKAAPIPKKVIHSL